MAKKGAAAKRAPENRADRNAETKSVKYPLHRAAAEGNIKAIEALCSQGITGIDECDENMSTPLLQAARNGHADAVLALILHGADVHVHTRGDRVSPLHLSASNGLVRATEALIAKGAHVNVLNLNALTPLHYAADKGHVAVIKVLLASGADPHAHGGPFHDLPLHLAAKRGHIDAMEVLLTKTDVNARTVGRSLTPLHCASKHGIEPSVNTVDSRSLAAIEFLLAKGADIDAVDESGYTMLQKAIECYNIVKAELFIAKGADVSICTRNGTALHFVRQPDVSILEKLLANGANVDAQDDEGRTALHMYVTETYKDATIIKLLLAAGAEVNMKNMYRQTPREVARIFGIGELASVALAEEGGKSWINM